MRQSLATALLTAGLLMAVAAQPASAAPYTVEICSLRGAGSGIQEEPQMGSFGLRTVFGCAVPNGEGGMRQELPTSTRAGGSIRWTLVAPDGTSINKVSALLAGRPWATNLFWEARSGLTQLDRIDREFQGRQVKYEVNGPTFSSIMQCLRPPCDGGQLPVFVSLRQIVAEMEDFEPPQATIPASPATAGPVHGTIELPIRVTDRGSGVRETMVLVDGILETGSSDSNEGKCAEPFARLVPCKASIESSIELDTTRLTDGPHEVQLRAIDASRQPGESAVVTMMVRNGPFNLERPRISGTAAIGAELTAATGTWEGALPSLGPEWLRCNADAQDGREVGCTPIPGAVGTRYVPTVADAGRRLVFKVVAANEFGKAAALSAPTALVPAPPADPAGPGGRPRTRRAPTLSGVSLSRKRLRGGKGTTLRFTANVAGKLSVAISPARRGKARRKNAKPLATLIRAVAAGPGSLPIGAKLNGKRLRPGPYTVTVALRSAGGRASASKVLRFRVLGQ